MAGLPSLKVPGIILLVVSGCGVGTSDSFNGWLGPQLHFELQGYLDGREISFSLREADIGANKLGFYGRRTWGVPNTKDPSTFSQGIFVEAEIRVKHESVHSFIEGMRMLEIEIKGEKELMDVAPGTAINVVPRDEARAFDVFNTPNSTYLEVEYKDLNDFKFFQEAAQEGTFVLHENTGTLSSDGLTMEPNTGTIGGFFRARWSVTEELTGSFTVPVLYTKIESSGGYI